MKILKTSTHAEAPYTLSKDKLKDPKVRPDTINLAEENIVGDNARGWHWQKLLGKEPRSTGG